MKNYWVAVGVMAGFCQGGGVGKCIAEWIIDGEPSIDVWAQTSIEGSPSIIHSAIHFPTPPPWQNPAITPTATQ